MTNGMVVVLAIGPGATVVVLAFRPASRTNKYFGALAPEPEMDVTL
jgi:hypothetical protein